MGREIRRVPKGWEHPRDERGELKPMVDSGYNEAARQWCEDYAQWQLGRHKAQVKNNTREPHGCKYFWEYESPPDELYFRPDFIDEPTHYQIYETVSEGTPVSPVFETLEELKQWLMANGVSEQAASRFAEEGWCLSGMFSPQTGFVTNYETLVP